MAIDARVTRDVLAQDMAEDVRSRNKALIRYVVDRLLNAGDLSVADEVWARDYKFHPGDGSDAMDRLTHKQDLTDLRSNFPDVQFCIDSMTADGDTVTTRLTVTGTHMGYLPAPTGTISPTGKKITWTAMTTHRIRNGKIVEGWINYDALGMLQQLGAVPAWKWAASAPPRSNGSA